MKNEIAEIKKQVSLARIAAARGLRFENRGNELWALCPFHTEKTPSFAIKLKDGEELFFCQGCGKGGDVIRFIEFADSCTTKDAIKKVREMAGEPEMATAVENKEWRGDAQRVAETFHNVAEEKEKIKVPVERWSQFETALQNSPAALKWLADVRGINADTAKQLRLGYQQTCKGFLKPEEESARDKGWICFPRIHGQHIVACKMRSISVKAFSQWKNMDAKALFNVDTINPLEPVFVTEGEFDTAIFEQADYRAVSIPNSNTKLTPEAKAALKGAAYIVLAGDNDGGVGNAAMRQLARELGENTYIVLWPESKDSNEFFIKHCGRNIATFRQRVDGLVAKAKSTPIEGFTSLIERLRSTGGTNAGKDPNRLHLTPESVDRMNYSPPGSIVVFYSTYSGTGKTVFCTQQMLHEAKRGQIVVVYSPELRDDGYLALVAAQTVGPLRENGLDRAGQVTAADYQETAGILDQSTLVGTDFRFYVGHQLPENDTDKVLEFIEQTIKVTGCTRFVIDTLHRVIEKSGRESTTEAEGRVVKKLEALGIKYGTIFILIGQSNKEAEDLKELRKDSHGNLRGSRELQDVAYAVYLIHRKRRATEGNPKDLLELDTDIVLKKDRGKGPGNAIVHLIYRPECSKFYEKQSEPSQTGRLEENHMPPSGDDAGFGI